MAKAGAAYVDFEGNFSGLHKQVNSQLKPLGGRFSKIGKIAAAGIGIGIAGLVKEGKAAVEAFADAEKVGAQTSAVLKSTGGAAGLTAKQIGNLATSISRKSGLDDEAVQSGENLLLTFTNVRNEAGKGNQIFSRATGIMADMSTALGQDMKSSAIQLGKALNDPVKGVTALQRVGVSFTTQQKDQIKTLVESGRTLDAQKMILRELNKEFGGSAAAFGKTGAGQVAKLKTEFGNLQEQIGARLAPALTDIAVKVRKFIQGMNDGTGAGGRFVDNLEAGFDRAKAALAPLTGALSKIWDRADLNFGEKLSRSISEAGPFIANAAAKVFIAAAPRAAEAFVSAWQGAGVWGRLFIVTTLASKLGVFSALAKTAAARFASAFRFAGPIGAVLALMAVLGRFGGASKSAAEATRDLAEAMDAQRRAARDLANHDLDLAAARQSVKASALAVERAEKDLSAARKGPGGKSSLAAREAENNLAQARTTHKRAVRDLGDVEKDVSSKRRAAIETVNETRKAQLEAAIATDGWSEGVGKLGTKIANLPARKQVTIDVNVQQAINNVNAASAAIDNMLDKAYRAIEAAKRAGKASNTQDRSPLLFGLEDRMRLAESARNQMQAMFDRNDAKTERSALKNALAIERLRKVTDSFTKGDKRKAISDAKAALADFNLQANRAAKLSKLDLRVSGVEKLIAFRDALKDVRGELQDKLSTAMDKFHDKWEKTIGADLDKAAQAALDAFDVDTQLALDTGPAAQALRELQAVEEQIQTERTDAQQAQAIKDAQAAVLAAKTADEKLAAQKQLDDALFEQAETGRQRKITAAQIAADEERVRIEKERAAARTAFEDQLQAERQTRYDTDSAAFRTLLKTQLDDEYAQLQQRKQNYSRFARDVNKIFKKFGLGFLLNIDAATEAATENAPARAPGGGGRPRAAAASTANHEFRFYLDGKEIDVRVERVVKQRDRATAAAVAGGIG